MVKLVVLLALGAVLAGCSGLSIPSFGGSGSGATVVVRAESNPAGAEARAQVGAPCRTPCTLEIPASGVSSVTFSLQGYLPQTVSVSVTASREGSDLPDTGVADQTRVEPNPVFAQLEVAPPPPPPPVRRKPAPRKPRPAPAAAQPAPPPPPPQQGFGPPPQQQPGGFGPPQQPVNR
ncbi:MAG: hypothetical protein ACXWJW_12970 [Xanthobacteraceae bacterium]